MIVFKFYCSLNLENTILVGMIRKYLTVGNLIFLLLLGVLLYKPARVKVQSWMMDLIGSPPVSSTNKVLSPDQMNFIYYNLKGDSFNLLDLRGKPIFLNFWGTWCGPCMAEMPSIEKLVESHDGKGEIILLSHESQDVLIEYQRKSSVELPIYFAKNVPDFVETENIPLTFVIDTAGKVLIEKTGAADWSDPHISELLQ